MNRTKNPTKSIKFNNNLLDAKEKHKKLHIKSRSHKYFNTDTKENVRRTVNHSMNRILNPLPNNANQNGSNGSINSEDHTKYKQTIEQNTTKTIESVNANTEHKSLTTVEKLNASRKSIR